MHLKGYTMYSSSFCLFFKKDLVLVLVLVQILCAPYISTYPTESDLCLLFLVRPFILKLNLWSITPEITVKLLYSCISNCGLSLQPLYQSCSAGWGQDGADKKRGATLEKSSLTWIWSKNMDPCLVLLVLFVHAIF